MSTQNKNRYTGKTLFASILIIPVVILQLWLTFYLLQSFSADEKVAAQTATTRHHYNFASTPLGCSSDTILSSYFAQHESKHKQEYQELSRLALHESNVPAAAVTCDFLLPLSYAQQALQNKTDSEGPFALFLTKFALKDVATILDGSLLELVACCLSRTIPILQDKALADLALHLGLVHFWSTENDSTILLCGSSPRTRHVIRIKEHDDTNKACVRVDNNAAIFDYGLADSNFNVVLQHFFLHAYSVKRLQDNLTTITVNNNNTLGILVSGDGKISNGGDLFGPLVAQQVLQTRNQSSIKVEIGKTDTVPPVIAVVGSTLQHSINRPNLIMWGTGIIKNMKVAKVNPTSTILAVRGPRTRDLLLQQQGLNPMVIGDPALLANDIIQPNNNNNKTRNVCFVIHAVDREYASTQCPYCMDRMVNNYNRNPLQILQSLEECKRVVSSSLHGVIFSHALAIPALPISLGSRITGGDFKFCDYMHSVGVTAFQSRLDMMKVWEERGNLTESEWIQMVDEAVQPEFPIPTDHFYKTFPNVV